MILQAKTTTKFHLPFFPLAGTGKGNLGLHPSAVESHVPLGLGKSSYGFLATAFELKATLERTIARYNTFFVSDLCYQAPPQQ